MPESIIEDLKKAFKEFDLNETQKKLIKREKEYLEQIEGLEVSEKAKNKYGNTKLMIKLFDSTINLRIEIGKLEWILNENEFYEKYYQKLLSGKIRFCPNCGSEIDLKENEKCSFCSNPKNHMLEYYQKRHK